MQKGDDNQPQKQMLQLTSSSSSSSSEEEEEEEIPEHSSAVAAFLFNGPIIPNTSISSSSHIDCPSYNDIAKVLSEVELPSPSPFLDLDTSCSLHSFHEAGESSDMSKMIDEIAVDIEPEMEEEEEEDANEDLEEPGKQLVSLPPITPVVSRGRWRSRVPEKIRALKALVPNCYKRDQVSILDDAIKYTKRLQTQLQMMQMGGGGTAMAQGLYNYMASHHHHQGQGVPYNPAAAADAYNNNLMLMMMMMMRSPPMLHGGSYNFTSFPVPPYVSCFGHGLAPPMQLQVAGSPARMMLPVPPRRLPLPPSTSSSSTSIHGTGSQVGSRISNSRTRRYHRPVTTQASYRSLASPRSVLYR